MLIFLQGLAGDAIILPLEARSRTLTAKGISGVKIASPKLQTSHLTANEEALLRCQTALDLKDKGDYEGAQEVMRPLWRGVGEHPDLKGIHASVAAEVLLCVGILTGWLGSKIQKKDAQETAKNLITESIIYFESVRDIKKIAAARVELAYCYWRDGQLNEAEIMLREALQKLTTEGDTRARALLKLTTVLWSAGRPDEALRILNENVALFKRLRNHATRGAFHGQLAIILRNLATPENQSEYFQRSVGEYKEADHHFRLARNSVFRADVKNNVGFLLYKLSRFKEAHKYLEEARRLTVSFKDKARTAQIDETRAQVLVAEGKFKDAEALARKAAAALTRGGHQCLVADVLITQGIALARLGRKERAQFIFQRAIDVALQVDALNKAGLAALTMIEEVSELSPATLHAAYQQAREWLSDSQSQEVLLRLNDAAGKLATSLRGELSGEEATEILLTKACDLQDRVLKYEGALIKEALAQTNGSVTRAAALLNLSHQGLAYIIDARHKDLLKERSPVRRRGRKASKST
jgi:tetratricopeptide (TPR) repeat protein